MQKTEAITVMGERSLLLPGWIKAALAANDRLKVYLSILQAAAAHGNDPGGETLDFTVELAAAHIDARWLPDIPGGSSLVDGDLLVPDLHRLVQRLVEDLATMAKPLLESGQDVSALQERLQYWCGQLDTLTGERITRAQLQTLTSGQRTGADDSVHLLIMDLHRALNQLASSLATEEIDGAHVWQLLPGDRQRVVAFMRGLNRTARLKFDHPGLETAVTRDGDRLLLQNDIGTNDAHVLVMQVEGLTITLSYSDLHRQRLQFLQALLAPHAAKWEGVESKIEATLNEGAAYTFCTARFDCADDSAVDATLEGIGSRIVFLIDWNRARKRLLPFVDKETAVAVLLEAAQGEAGHMAWLKAGGEALIYSAMQDVGQGVFRIGDRLDAVLGVDDARTYLVEVLKTASRLLAGGQPAALVADETRLLLAQRVRQHSREFDLLEEHAAYCNTLAQAVSDGLMHEALAGADSARALAARAKVWERQADHLVMRAREQARRQPRWQPFARLIELSDDVADALEEAAFLMSLIAEDHQQGWNSDVKHSLAETVLDATQEHVKALCIARCLSDASGTSDSDSFLAALWNVLRSEREADELLRSARRAILGAVRDAPALMLANDLAATLETASDRLLVAGYALRDVAFGRAGVGA
jgi:uncharacterized protein Yka (UPF0111/DUF47 family)